MKPLLVIALLLSFRAFAEEPRITALLRHGDISTELTDRPLN